jgi:inner membrane protein
MPSPIAHLAVGYVAYRVIRPKKPLEQTELSYHKTTLPLLAVSLGLSMLPDVDVVPGLLLGDFGRFHNTVTNSTFVGLAVAALVGAVGWFTGWYRWRRAFLLTAISYWLHIFMDYSTGGRGVMLLWPISAERIASPVQLFYGLRWSSGLFSTHHIWTIGTELLFVAALAGGFWFFTRRFSSKTMR